MSSFKNNYQDYYLDLEILSKKDKHIYEKINDYYREALSLYEQSFHASADSYYKSLIMSGYLKNYDQNVRGDKIKKVTDESTN